ncbi:MAG: hypothetical protein ACON4Z_15590 [Planctomycetota bacterium]
MFLDAVWAHLGMFAIGQLFAWRYARSGRFWLGASATALLWIALDAWLVARYVLDLASPLQAAPLVALYAVVLGTAASFLWAGIRRLRGRSTRRARHAAAIACSLRGAGEEAIGAYRGLVWADGWDVAAWVGLGDAERRYGKPRRAARCYRRARSVDVARRFLDVIEHRERLLALAGRASGEVVGRVEARAPRRARPGRKAETAS